MNQNENYLYTLYMNYRKVGRKDLKEEEKLTKQAKKMHSEMVWYPKLFKGTMIFAVIAMIVVSVYGLFMKEETMSIGEVLTVDGSIFFAVFVAIAKMKGTYQHSLDKSEPMKSTREQAIYGILTGNFKAIVEIPTEVSCECGFVMKPEAGFCNECGKKNPRQVSPMANSNPAETNLDLWKLPTPAMPTMMVVLLMMIVLVCVWAMSQEGDSNTSTGSSANASPIASSSSQEEETTSNKTQVKEETTIVETTVVEKEEITETPEMERKGDITSQTSLNENLNNYGSTLYQIGTMLLKNNSYDDYVNQDMSGVLMYYEQESVGYAFVDVNYDGVDELILGSLNYPSGRLFSMYYLSNSGIVSAVHGAEREQYTLCTDGVVLYTGSNSATDTTIYSLELTQSGMNVVNGDRAKDFFNLTDEYIPKYTPLSEYFGDSSVYTEDAQSNNQTTAQQERMYDDYAWYISLIASSMDVGSDKWDFINHDLNGELAYYSIWDIGYSLIDVNFDGIDELVINIHDSKTPLSLYYWNGSGVSLAFNASARSQYAIFSDGLIVIEEADGSDPITYELTLNGLHQVTDSRKKTFNDFYADNSKAYLHSNSLAEWWYS